MDRRVEARVRSGTGEAEEGKDGGGSSQSVESGGNYWTIFIIYTTPHLHQLIEEHKSESSAASASTFVLNILQILVIILAF